MRLELGVKVILLEKDESIAHNIRTSGVTWIEEIEKLGISKEYYNPIKNYSFISPSNEITIKESSAKACVLNVRSAYQHLAILGAEAGADIMIKANVTSRTLNMENHISELKVHTPKGDLLIACTLVIDASGFNTSIGRKAGIVNEWKRYGVGAEYECYCENIDPDTWQLMVGQDYSNAGYAWVFPLSRNRVRIGVGIGRPESDEDRLQKLHYIMEKRYKPMDKMGKIQPIEFHYGFIPNQGFRQLHCF